MIDLSGINLTIVATHLINVVFFTAPTLMLCQRLPHRSHYAVRVSLCLVVLYLYLTSSMLGGIEGETMVVFTAMSIYFALVVVFLLLMVLVCNETNPWTAAYCAVVGYTVQNLGSGFGELLGIVVRMNPPLTGVLGNAFVRYVICCLITYAVFYVGSRQQNREGFDIDTNKWSFVLVIGVVLVNIVFDMAVKYLRAYSVPPSFSLTFRIVQIAICFYALALEVEMLHNRRLLLEAATLQRLLRDRERQYQTSRENIDAINTKCHDIRHQIRHLGEDGVQVVDKSVLDDIAHQINIYDSTVKTGNDVLDTILTEKKLLGSGENITLSCMADGHALDFMSSTDLYSLFGNALDNSFEAVRDLDDEGKRNISLLVREVGGMVSIHVENYFDGVLKIDASGNPLTTKEDLLNHGYGVKSMRHIAERYDGTLTVGTEGQAFYLNILIPIKPSQDEA